MKKLVRIDSSLQGSASVSKQLADLFQGLWQQANADHEIIHHDFGAKPLAHIDQDFLSARAVDEKDRSLSQRLRLLTSTQLIAELKEADQLLISVPMYNFGIPSALKAYFDHIAVAGETFNYTDEGPQGALTHLKATVLIASGGDYTQAPADQMDFVTPYIKTFLGFIGITEVTFVTAPGLARSGDQKELAVEGATQQIVKMLDNASQNQVA